MVPMRDYLWVGVAKLQQRRSANQFDWRSLIRTRAIDFLTVVLLVAFGATLGACSRNFVPLEVGQCLPDGSGIEGRRAQQPRTVPCSTAHRYQVFAVEKLEPPTNKWPGDEIVTLNAEQLCASAIKKATGLEPHEVPEDVELFHVDPTEGSWQGGDRDVECLFRWDVMSLETLVRSSN